MPHPGQNFTWAGRTLPHFAQVHAFAKSLPQKAQVHAPCWFVVPQWTHWGARGEGLSTAFGVVTSE
ncbi:MAG: hypothetical protein Q8N51_01155 [Gammaproteobacteria bacterium]|nr:hypothetical protein [Gammaproteobacteria bacterium]